MTRRKSMVHREPNGKPSRTDVDRGPSPSAMRRLRDAALSGMADHRWGSELGRLHLVGKITDAMYAAGIRWSERASTYRHVIDSPALDPRAVDLNRMGGSGVDPDSNEGQREAKRHRRACDSFQDAHVALKMVGRKPAEVMAAVNDGLTLRTLMSERVVRALCESNTAPVGFDEMKAACTGLSALAEFWGLTTKSKSSHVR